MEERGSIYKPPCKQKVSFPWEPWERMREGRQSQFTGCSSYEFPGPDRVRAVDQLHSTSGCLWGLVLILSSLRALASFLAASTGSQCFSRQNVTNWGWSSTSCRSKSVLLAVFAQGILGVSFLAPMPSVNIHWLACLLVFLSWLYLPARALLWLSSTWNKYPVHLWWQTSELLGFLWKNHCHSHLCLLPAEFSNSLISICLHFTFSLPSSVLPSFPYSFVTTLLVSLFFFFSHVALQGNRWVEDFRWILNITSPLMRSFQTFLKLLFTVTWPGRKYPWVFESGGCCCQI